jgi:hypothetical protein
VPGADATSAADLMDHPGYSDTWYDLKTQTTVGG